MENSVYRILIVLISIQSIVGQNNDTNEAKELLYKTKMFYEDYDGFSINTQYVLYADQKSNDRIEGYIGFMVKKDKNYYSKIHNTESIYINGEFVKINHDEKAILYAQMDKENIQINALNIDELLQNFDKISVSEVGNDYLVKLTSTMITQLPYGAVFIYVNSDDYSIRKQTMFLIQKIPVTASNGQEVMTTPRLEIEFSDFVSTNLTRYNYKFDIESYISMGGKKRRASDQFKNYEFIDTTTE